MRDDVLVCFNCKKDKRVEGSMLCEKCLEGGFKTWKKRRMGNY